MIPPVPSAPEPKPPTTGASPNEPGFEAALRNAETTTEGEHPARATSKTEEAGTEGQPADGTATPAATPWIMVAMPQLATAAASPGGAATAANASAQAPGQAAVTSASAGALAAGLPNIAGLPSSSKVAAPGTAAPVQAPAMQTAEAHVAAPQLPDASKEPGAADPGPNGLAESLIPDDPPKSPAAEAKPADPNTTSLPQAPPPAAEARAAHAAAQHAVAHAAPTQVTTSQQPGQASEAARAAPVQAPPPSEQVAPVILAQAVRPGAPTRTIMELRPAELGRVEIAVETRRDGPAEVRIVAERPEALAALQRDRPALEAALRSAGFDGQQATLSFDLGGDRRPPQERTPPTAGPRTGTESAARTPFAFAADAAAPRASTRLLDLAL